MRWIHSSRDYVARLTLNFGDLHINSLNIWYIIHAKHPTYLLCTWLTVLVYIVLSHLLDKSQTIFTKSVSPARTHFHFRSISLNGRWCVVLYQFTTHHVQPHELKLGASHHALEQYRPASQAQTASQIDFRLGRTKLLRRLNSSKSPL